MAASKELKALIVLAGKIDPSLQAAMLKATGESQKLSAGLQKSAKSLNQIGTIAKGTFLGVLAAKGFTYLTSKMAGVASESIGLASDLTEVQNVVDTTFGSSARAIDAWAKTAKKGYGLSTLQAKQYASTMGAMLKSSGVANRDLLVMSQNLTGLAGDMASFYNLSQDEAFEKIRAGISGETEPLKKLGINMSVANLEVYALSKGIKTAYSKMDQASQTLLRYNYLMERSKDAQGDFARTLGGSYANQRRLFQTNLQEISATLAEKLLPNLTKLYVKANTFLMNIDLEKAASLAGAAFDNLGNALAWVQENAGWLTPVLLGTVSALAAFEIINRVKRLMEVWRVVTTLQTLAQNGLNAAMLANPIGLTAVAIGLLVAAGTALWKNWDAIIKKAGELWSAFKRFLGFGSQSAELQANISGAQKLTGYRMVQGFASGGIATRPSIFGEAGPEIAIPLRRTPRSLGLLNAAAQIIGAGSAQNGGISLTYAPVIYGNNRAEIEPILRKHKDELAELFEEILAEKARVAYGS